MRLSEPNNANLGASPHEHVSGFEKDGRWRKKGMTQRTERGGRVTELDDAHERHVQFRRLQFDRQGPHRLH